MVFGKSKSDVSQDSSIQELWKWIQQLNANQAVLIKNNSYFIKRDQLFAKCITELQQKDKQHDQKDAEHTALIQSVKDMAKAVETVEAEGGE